LIFSNFLQFIFFKFDPVAYRLEPLINKSTVLKPVLIPHHKGRKRFHLELRESLTKVEDLRQKMYGQLKNAWSSLAEYAKLPKIASETGMSAQIEAASSSTNEIEVETATTTTVAMSNNIKEDEAQTRIKNQQIKAQLERENSLVDFGLLNKSRRVDYVLQERPIESFNEYLFALASHACYW
jgi:hypothetical protein